MTIRNRFNYHEACRKTVTELEYSVKLILLCWKPFTLTCPGYSRMLYDILRFSNGVSCMRDPYWSRKGTVSYMSVLYCSLFMLAAEEMC